MDYQKSLLYQKIFKILGLLAFLSGVVELFLNPKIGLTLLVLWFAFSGSLTVLFEPTKHLKAESNTTKLVKETLVASKKRASLFLLLDAGALFLIWYL